MNKPKNIIELIEQDGQYAVRKSYWRWKYDTNRKPKQ